MNLITLTDSYKLSHWTQYPEGTERIFLYLDGRSYNLIKLYKETKEND